MTSTTPFGEPPNAETSGRRSGLRRWLGFGTTAAAWFGVALMPKCPLCVAVALSGVGLGSAWVSALSPYARSGSWGVAMVALLGTLYVERRRSHAQRAGHRRPSRACCG